MSGRKACGASDTAGLEALISRAREPAKVCRRFIAGIRILRRSRHGDQARRHLVLPRHTDRPHAARPAFSTVLRKDEDGKIYLVTPVEKVGIRVEDAPFVVVEMNASGKGASQIITFRTNVGDVVEAGPSHPLHFVDEDETGGLKPYVLVRDRLEALINRPVMYELIEHGEEIDIDGTAMFAVRSHGEIYPIMPVEKLRRLSA
jgi:hypothetical protein